ncbi:minor head structural component GP7 [Sporolactobacillus laevolacticus]|uniref:Minor head structural component GP7 n=1 Tax=Sporolactobacillus laevolacticus DSM 442 TaxID=1395513 RepID=V6IXL6_9BACL|nr:minor head structural component GP7 [Sporolactobacillus laevolacticus]EST12050.1 minor head structural component GP7 [Sporolactobacillus laevolacticus DSM 442]
MTDDEIKKLVDYLNRNENRIIKDIGRQYKKSLDALISRLSQIYVKGGKDQLNFSDVARTNDIAKLENFVLQQADKLQTENRRSILGLLVSIYIYSFDTQKSAIETEVKKALGFDFWLKNSHDAEIIHIMQGKSDKQIKRLLMALEKNDIEGLKLTPALERNRRMIIQDIKQAIERGFIEKKGYTSMAKGIQGAFDMGLNRATAIARTEGHRVRETASYDSAMNADFQGIKMQKFWMNMGDERVRHRPGANHVSMEGQTRDVNEPFDLGWGIQAQYPGMSGDAANDIRCRCIARYKIVGIDPSLKQGKRGGITVE